MITDYVSQKPHDAKCVHSMWKLCEMLTDETSTDCSLRSRGSNKVAHMRGCQKLLTNHVGVKTKAIFFMHFTAGVRCLLLVIQCDYMIKVERICFFAITNCNNCKEYDSDGNIGYNPFVSSFFIMFGSVGGSKQWGRLYLLLSQLFLEFQSFPKSSCGWMKERCTGFFVPVWRCKMTSFTRHPLPCLIETWGGILRGLCLVCAWNGTPNLSTILKVILICPLAAWKSMKVILTGFVHEKKIPGSCAGGSWSSVFLKHIVMNQVVPDDTPGCR